MIDIQFPHSFDYFLQDATHADAWVLGISNADITAVEIDGGELTDAVGEAGGIESLI